ncbi:hypothetical protein BDY21DRAFT_383975 [Lineolata rhizophorae]|uniref:Uncharacterized protein n=1 Tax=Lineolata rhizophorae TaxID=578093 RepID=A0A6A6P930_9PEZI|nr:hypothetical protein BDY21DRAFT_383975 [Lineolata rhizophorae]
MTPPPPPPARPPTNNRTAWAGDSLTTRRACDRGLRYVRPPREQQADRLPPFRPRDLFSRPSSSSGSVPQSLRRTPNLEDLSQRQSRQRSASLSSPTRRAGPPPQPQPSVRFADDPEQSAHRRSQSHSGAQGLRAPHPATRISRRTASAILYALEEALRTPHPFTPDLEEENASMSDLLGGPGAGGNGRPSNGGARTAPGQGPIPVPQQASPGGARTQRRAEADSGAAGLGPEQRRAAAQDGRTGMPRPAAEPETAPQRHAPGAVPPGAEPQPPRYRPLQPTQPLEQPQQFHRPRGPSAPQQYEHPRPAPAQPEPSVRRPSQPSQPQPGASAAPHAAHGRPPGAGPGPSAAPPPQRPTAAEGTQARDPNVSTFPHAFERWETLSSHWEGLTSYWIRRLEQNIDETRREPLAQQMARQITDLSAAGANLFHAVVELQRLRASSERKFQRWFFETRAEQERAQERQAELQRLVDHSQTIQRESMADAERARRQVAEMRRELQISKDEARRAWEELGRREQEERDRTMSLREGQPTLVGGMQVVPMQGGIGSRHGSISQGPGSREGPYQSVPAEAAYGQEGIGEYGYGEAQSPTDTDPFTEGSRKPLHHEPERSTLAMGGYAQYPTGVPAQQPGPSTVQQPRQPRGSPPQTTEEGQPTTPTAQSFYRQTGSEILLHQPPEQGTQPPSRPPTSQTYSDTQSYVPSQGDTFSEGEEEQYELDEHGNVKIDDQGRPVIYRGPRLRSPQEEDDDEFDVQEDLRREQEHALRYGGYTSAGGRPGASQTTSGAGYGGFGAPADYSGAGYSGWEGYPRQHHHPSRLSNIFEEDEASRTSPSRTSQISRR